MRRHALAPLAVTFALLLAAGCSSDSKDGADATTTTGAADATTTTSAAATTTPETAPPTTAPATTAATAPPTTAAPSIAESYAKAFVAAWAAGDQAKAATLGTGAAVAKIFQYEAGGEEGSTTTWSLTKCEGAGGSTTCTFTAGGDPKIVVRVDDAAASSGQPQAVTEVQVPA